MKDPVIKIAGFFFLFPNMELHFLPLIITMILMISEIHKSICIYSDFTLQNIIYLQ
jgi:hypothetical protein